MDERSQKTLDAILTKDPTQITEEDKAFLRARWHYVGKNSRQKFAEVLDEKPQQTEADTNTAQDPESEKKNNPDHSTHPADLDNDEEDSTDGDQDSDQDEQ